MINSQAVGMLAPCRFISFLVFTLQTSPYMPNVKNGRNNTAIGFLFFIFSISVFDVFLSRWQRLVGPPAGAAVVGEGVFATGGALDLVTVHGQAFRDRCQLYAQGGGVALFAGLVCLQAFCAGCKSSLCRAPVLIWLTTLAATGFWKTPGWKWAGVIAFPETRPWGGEVYRQPNWVFPTHLG